MIVYRVMILPVHMLAPVWQRNMFFPSYGWAELLYPGRCWSLHLQERWNYIQID